MVLSQLKAKEEEIANREQKELEKRMKEQELLRQEEAEESEKHKVFGKRLALVVAWPVSGIIGSLISFAITGNWLGWPTALLSGPISLLVPLVRGIGWLDGVGVLYGLFILICMILVLAIIVAIILWIIKPLFPKKDLPASVLVSIIYFPRRIKNALSKR